MNERKQQKPIVDITLIALDIANDAIELACANRVGHIVARHRLKRQGLRRFFIPLPPIIDACGMTHHWARELGSLGDTVRLLSDQYVRAPLDTGKTDLNDAATLLETARTIRVDHCFACGRNGWNAHGPHQRAARDAARTRLPITARHMALRGAPAYQERLPDVLQPTID